MGPAFHQAGACCELIDSLCVYLLSALWCGPRGICELKQSDLSCGQNVDPCRLTCLHGMPISTSIQQKESYAE